MTTATAIKKTSNQKFNARAFVSFAFAKMGDSIGDMIITVAVTGLMLTFIALTMPIYIDTPINGLIIAGMMVQLFIRIVHRFDDHYTADELAERLIEFESSVKEQLNRIERNQ